MSVPRTRLLFALCAIYLPRHGLQRAQFLGGQQTRPLLVLIPSGRRGGILPCERPGLLGFSYNRAVSLYYVRLNNKKNKKHKKKQNQTKKMCSLRRVVRVPPLLSLSLYIPE